MSNNFYSPHPEDDELLGYSDGELSGSDVGRVRKHLKDCWRCRTQLEDVQATVTGFMRYRDHTLVPNLPAPPQPWKALKADFDRIDRENAKLAATSGMLARFGPMPAMRYGSRIAVGLAVVAAIGFAAGYFLIQRNNEVPVIVTPPPTSSVKPDEAVVVRPDTPPRSATASPAVPSAVETRARILNAEVEVAVALHQAGADLGEPVEVAREGNGIVVTGTALTASRRQELTAALAPIPGVSLRWEDTRISRNPARPNASFDAGRLPWQTELETALGGKSALERTSNELLDLSDTVASRAVALEKLRTQFASASLNPDDQAKVAAISTDHQRELRKAVENLIRRATPVFEKLGVDPAAAKGAATQVTVLQAAQKTDQLLNVLFAGADANSRSLAQTVEDLKNAMARLKAVAAQ